MQQDSIGAKITTNTGKIYDNIKVKVKNYN